MSEKYPYAGAAGAAGEVDFWGAAFEKMGAAF